ncbi:lysophospholipid acyltransferase family protein [Methylotenera sp. G11]|uniref:lysophospholipid acyltransferase family protein n=1 Tax=Methylotenera sp. G11 TaxID=1506585 RepID=UPI0006487DAE|nr:lysophospholipid acyltransferase family protein [Methylotenera sp. G11]
MLKLLSKILSRLPLPTIHRIGKMLGWLLHRLTPSTVRIQRANLRQSGLCRNEAEFEQVIKENTQESGKAILETLAIWAWSEQEAVGKVQSATNWHLIDEALARGKGLIFLTPHLGCFEITSIYYGHFHPITVLFRPPKKSWIAPLIDSGRSKGNVKLAPANTAGVRLLMQALKNNEAIGILPDQKPAAGEGEWAPFFGKPAYTMSLASKLAEKTGATVIMAFGERLAHGKGFRIHCSKLEDHAIATPDLLNQAIEQQIRQCPSQYYWGYHRYKVSRKAKPPPSATG